MKPFLFIAALLISDQSFNQNTGIGTTTPATTLYVRKGNSGGYPYADFTVLTVENNNHTYISLLSPAGLETGVVFGQAGSPTNGSILYDNASTPNGFQFRDNGNQTRMVIDNNGNLGIGTVTPGFPLNFSNGTGDKIALWGSSGVNKANDYHCSLNTCFLFSYCCRSTTTFAFFCSDELIKTS